MGFRPFRLLGWIAAVLLIDTVSLWATDGQPIPTARRTVPDPVTGRSRSG
ncbi:hypothetical protein ACW2Q0_26680 [Nocardia sp. R16R-3T]